MVYTTSTKEDRGKKARRLIFYKKNGEIHVDFEELEGDYPRGTKVQVRSSWLVGRRQEAQEHIRAQYADSEQIRIYLDGDLVNKLQGLRYLNGQPLDYVVKTGAVYINTYEDGFEVIDEATGMDNEVLLTVLPLFRRGTSQEIRQKFEDSPKAKATALYIHEELTDSEHPFMTVNLVVGSRVMAQDTFRVKDYGLPLPRRITIKLPILTRLTDTKDEVIVTKPVIKAIEYLTGRLIESNMKDIFPAINGFSQILINLQRKTTKTEYNLVSRFTNRVSQELLVPYAKSHKVIFMPNTQEFLNLRLNTEKQIVYLDRIFFEDGIELFNLGLQELPFYNAGKAYAIPLAEGQEPLFVYKDILFIDEGLTELLSTKTKQREAVELINALLDEAKKEGYKVEGYFEIVETEDGFRALLNRLKAFKHLSASEKEQILMKLANAGIKEETLTKVIALLKEQNDLKSKKERDKDRETQGEVKKETFITKVPLPQSLSEAELGSLYSVGQLGKAEYLHAKVAGREYIIDSRTGVKIFDYNKAKETLGGNPDISVEVKNDKFLMTYREDEDAALDPLRRRYQRLYYLGSGLFIVVFLGILPIATALFLWVFIANIVLKIATMLISTTALYVLIMSTLDRIIGNWRANKIAQAIRNSFSETERPQARILIWMGENLYLADLAKAKATRIKQGFIPNWLRKNPEVTTSGNTIYLSSGTARRWLIERIDMDESGRLRKEVITTGRGEKSIYPDDNGIFVLYKSQVSGETKFYYYDAKSRNRKEQILGKGVFKLIHYGQQRYYFERENLGDSKNILVYDLASGKLEELNLEPVNVGH